jgi:hypothetical protein
VLWTTPIIKSGILIKDGKMSLEKVILDKVRHLPSAQQEEVLRFADGLQRKAAVRTVPCRDRTREITWISEIRVSYAYQWVALEGDRLVASGPDPLKVFGAGREQGIQTPFIVHVLPEDSLPLVPGW